MDVAWLYIVSNSTFFDVQINKKTHFPSNKLKKKINDKIITKKKILDESYIDNYNLLINFHPLNLATNRKKLAKFLASVGIDEDKKFVCFGVRTKFLRKKLSILLEIHQLRINC